MSESPKSVIIEPSGSGPSPLVLVVLPRIVDLVIQQDRDLAPAFFSQHRSSYALRRERLLEIVDLDEIGLDDKVELPPEVVLVSQPRQRRIVGREQTPEWRQWRLAASALAILRFDEARANGTLTTSRVHERIETIGHDTFAEIEAVLRRELRLFEDDDLVRVYAEFVTLHAGLSTFAPHALDVFFPSLAGRHHLIAERMFADVHWKAILEEVRPRDAALPIVPTQSEHEAAAAEDEALESPLPPLRPNARRFESLMKWGESTLDRGNAVVSAILFRRAGRLAPDQQRAERAEQSSHKVIQGLVSRLQKALAFDEQQAQAWSLSLADLFRHSSRGFWNTNKRLLYDLQKVCVAYERPSSTIDLFGYLRSFGRRPLKRPLPNQREVLMSKQLRSASSRLAKARLTSSQRATLSKLLREAADSAEAQLRRHLRIRIARSLNAKGLQPENIPEKVARSKLIEELLDVIVSRGHLNMGDVRDAISRSQLKLSDLRARELWEGDAILRADRRLSRLLDGVYRSGEFYLRGLQWLSSLGFGRSQGRFLIKFLVVPFVGAYMILEMFDKLWKVFSGSPSILSYRTSIPEGWFPEPLNSASFSNLWPAVLLLGAFITGLLYAPAFRQSVWLVTQTTFRLLKHVVIDGPRWILSLKWARWILRSRLAKAVRRYVAAPMIPAVVIYLIATLALDFNRYTAVGTFVVIFAAINFFLNSSAGRRFEEYVGAWAARTWYQFRVQVIRSLFDAIMGFFRQLLEFTERVLYAIDEWLLFKTGENRFTFWIKACLGAIWSVVAYVIRAVVTLLVEPQINPIKHFPVVTVSHKLLLPTQPFLAKSLAPALGNPMALTVAGFIVMVLPGVAGFLVWELKSNWRLYRGNRDGTLKPAAVGPHGESFSRLLKPGFHSGMVGKLYGKMRRTERQVSDWQRRQTLATVQHKLHHVEVAVRHFIEREFFGLLRHYPETKGLHLEVSEVRLLPNAIRVRLILGGQDFWKHSAPLHLLYQARRDWLVAKFVSTGWLDKLARRQQEIIITALAGVYKLSGVDLVDEQLKDKLNHPTLLYHLRFNDIEVWPGDQPSMPVTYPLRSWGMLRPQPATLAKSLRFPAVPIKQLVYAEQDIPWQAWVDHWEERPESSEDRTVLDAALHWLPPTRHDWSGI